LECGDRVDGIVFNFKFFKLGRLWGWVGSERDDWIAKNNSFIYGLSRRAAFKAIYRSRDGETYQGRRGSIERSQASRKGIRTIGVHKSSTMDDPAELESFLHHNEYTDTKSSTQTTLPETDLPSISLPPRSILLRFLRYSVFSVYRRIFLSIFLLNIWQGYHIITLPRRSKYSPLLVDISTLFSLNLFLAILIRQDYIINLLFKLCWIIPHSTPLRIRRSLAKIYEYGGLHSGAAVCSVLWFSLLSLILVWEYRAYRIADPLILASSGIIILLLWAILITAFPALRINYHNLFERIHRFGGWIVLVLFWIELYLFTRALGHQAGPSSPGAELTKLPAFYLLLLSTFHVALPWFRLRRLELTPERLGVGVHAIRLHHSEAVKSCVVYRIATSPLDEWHSFACIPSSSGKGGSLIVSNAGDWTRRTVNNPSLTYYTRGIPTVGVLCLTRLFRNIIIVTTGSGIGPCLGTLSSLSACTRFRILWSASDPRSTFGEGICEEVRRLDGEAVVIDTKREGRRDLGKLAYNLYRSEEAEAVFVVSNRKVTRRVVYELESRGVPCFGPVWDS
jgi:hypothetical protein